LSHLSSNFDGGILHIASSSHLGRSSSGQTFGLHAEYQSRYGRILPTQFCIWQDDRFEPYNIRFRWRNPLGRIQCPRRCANPPGVQVQCLRDQIRDLALIHFSLEARALLLEQFSERSDDLSFRASFPAGSGYRTSPESHILSIYPCMHQICYHLLITGIFMLFSCILVMIHEI
jgi:hypothetical protein